MNPVKALFLHIYGSVLVVMAESYINIVDEEKQEQKKVFKQ